MTEGAPSSTPARLLSPELAPVTIATLSTVALAAFDGIAVITVLPSITGDLGDVSMISWVITGFLVASTIAVIVAGPVIDALGVRATFRATLVIFGLASVACALAPSIPVLVAFRVVQGVGGGMIVAVALAAVGLVYPEELMPRAYATISALWGGMAIIGPAVAAGLVALAGWRAMFLVNVPLCALAALFAWNRFPGRRDDAQVLRFDVRGIVLLGAFTAVSLVGLSSFSITAAVAVAVAVVLAGLYWIHTARAEAPVLERQFFARMPLRGIHLASAAVFGGCLGLNAFLPLYVQGGLRHSSGTAAASLLFLSAGWSLGSIGVSRLLTRVSPVDTALAGFGFVIPGVALGLVFLGPGAPIGAVWIIAFIQGLGVGIVSTSLLTHLQRQITETGVGRANAAHQYPRAISPTPTARRSSARSCCSSSGGDSATWSRCSACWPATRRPPTCALRTRSPPASAWPTSRRWRSSPAASWPRSGSAAPTTRPPAHPNPPRPRTNWREWTGRQPPCSRRSRYRSPASCNWREWTGRQPPCSRRFRIGRGRR